MPKGCSPSRARRSLWRRRGKGSRRAPVTEVPPRPRRSLRSAVSVDDAVGAQALPEDFLVRVGDAVLAAHGERRLDDELQVSEDAVAVGAAQEVGLDESDFLVTEQAGVVVAEQFDTSVAVHFFRPFLWGGVVSGLPGGPRKII